MGKEARAAWTDMEQTRQAQQAELLQRMEVEFQERLAASIREREGQMRAMMGAQLASDRAEMERHVKKSWVGSVARASRAGRVRYPWRVGSRPFGTR